MKTMMAKMPMQRRMMIYFAVPLLIIQIVIAASCYPALLVRFRKQMDYLLGQSINQAVSFLESYIHNMEYLTQLVENNGQIYGVLTAEQFMGEKRPDEQYMEFYMLNRTFNSLEFSNSLYRFGLYISDDIAYVNNNYFIFPQSRLEERNDHARMKEYFASGRDYLVLSEERKDIGSRDMSKMLTLYHQILNSSTEEIVGICSISIDMDRIVQVMENANITSRGLVYLVNAEGEGIVSSNETLFKELREWDSFPLKGEEISGQSVKMGRTTYYADRKDIENTGWQMVSLIPAREYDGQYRSMVLLAVISVVIMAFTIMMVSYFLSNYYVGRLKKLGLQMKHLQDGNLNVQLPSIQQGDEIEEVYRNFNFMVGEVRRLLKEEFQLGKDVRVAELRALQAQINPHFLYNTLDLINWIAMDYGAEDIEKIAWNLARFYRLSLNRGQNLISIGEEAEHVQVYVNIQKFHYDDAVHLEVDIPEELKSLACLNIILQPFVENAILHGIGERTEISQCSIAIRVQKQGDNILFTVKDDGPGMTQRQMEEAETLDISQIKGGYGVKNINFRIKLCFGEEYGVRYESVLGEGTTAFILIPAMTMEEAEKKIM